MGHPPTAPAIANLLAETTVRIAAQRTGLAGLLTAGLLVAGDAHAYGWDGQTLTRHTTPHTFGETLRRYGAPWDTIADSVDHVVTASLADAVPALVPTVATTDPLVILASDGLDAVPQDDLAALVREHAGNPQAIADALVAAPGEDEAGYRDDVTVVVIAHT
jgi:protein phosphatase